MSVLNIYRASAGSGKTYTLTYNYLRLALKYPDKFRSILAVTFTNKATEEMKSRIIFTLRELSSGEHSMSMDLQNELSINSAQLQKRAADLLVNILHNYSFFAISTIDTFFQKIVRSFTREMGIQSGYRVELDQQKVLSEVVDELLSSLSEDKNLIRWLTEYAIHQIEQGKSWDSRREIKSLSNELLKEEVLLNHKEIFDSLESEEHMNGFLKSIFEKRSSLEQEYRSLGQTAVDQLAAQSMECFDLAYGKSGVGGYILAVANGEYKEPTGRTFNAIEEDAWLSKTSKLQGAMELALQSGLRETVRLMVDTYSTQVKEYNSINLIAKNLYAFGLLSKVNQGIEQYREDNEILLIGDFPVFLKEIISDSDSPYIYEKVGSRYDHFLIDEFQDTSGLQWLNFKPLVHDSLSSGNENLIVGDIKQSIYRWRGGDWKILLERVSSEIQKEYLQDNHLSTNHRSQKVVVDFNNAFFSKAPEILESHLEKKEPGIGPGLKLSMAYNEVAQASKYDSEEGYVSIDFLEKDELEDVDEAVIQNTITQIKWLQDHNYSAGDITILVRKNGQGRQIANALMGQAEDKKYDFSFISNESLFVKNNAVVHFILQVLDMMASPEDDFKIRQAEEVFVKYLGRFDHENVRDFLSSLASRKNVTLTRAVQMVENEFSFFERESDLPFLMAFHDAIQDYLSFNHDNIRDFLVWWEDKKHKRSIQGSGVQNAIQIMTIHQSKGLQFKAVTIPWADWSMDAEGFIAPLLWCSTAELSGIDTQTRVPIRYSGSMRNSVFSEEYYREKNDAFLDNLNLLYVAMTRPEEVLMMTCPLYREKSADIKSAADLVFEYVKSCVEEEDIVGYALGKVPEYSRYDRSTSEVLKLDSRALQDKEDWSVRSIGMIAQEDRQRSIEFGEVVHWIFSQIRAKDDFQSATERAWLKFSLSDEDKERVKLILRETWEVPGVSDWFSSDWNIRNEQNILLSNGQIKRPDRVISNDKETIVIDFKTGKPTEGHKKQVQGYKNLLGQMGHQKVSGYLLYFSPVIKVEV